MLFKLSLKNIQKSIKDYAIYFFTLILGVAVFYVFNAIESQTVLLNVTSNTQDIIKLMTNILSGVSVFVSFVLGFLIIYASRFLVKRRNKEFGVYLTLGMGKRKVSMILFFETMLIGIISLAVGLLLGTVLSQFMSLLVANMFEADMTNYAFTFSKDAMFKTFIYFGIMYVLVMIFNTRLVSKCKLIDLLHAGKKSEKVRMKNPVLCTLVFAASCGILGYAYWKVTGGLYRLSSEKDIFIPIILGVIGTFLVFWSLSGLMLRIVMSIKGLYYKKLNSFTLRQISSKINTMVFSMTVICLMLFFTICILSSALSIKNFMNDNLKELAPVDIQFESANEPGQESYTVEELLKQNNFNVDEVFKERFSFDTYMFDDITLQTTLGSAYNEAQNNNFFLSYTAREEFMKLSDYNRLAKLYGMPEYTLEEDEYIVIADFDSSMDMRNLALKNGEIIRIGSKEYRPKYEKCKKGILQLAGNHVNAGYFVIPDSAETEGHNTRNYLVANYNTGNVEEKIRIEAEISELTKSIGKDGNTENRSSISYNTMLDIKEASIGLGAMVTFIGLYLGIIFLISGAAILALKELSESTDNRERYSVLRKIGTDEKVINRALFKQIGIFFMVPLILAGIHSVFGIRFCNSILETFGKDEMMKSVGMTSVFLIVIYGGYFLITYFCSKEIIKERK
ncbi:MAG: ABC transporter permease [Lachnospiraceae bacterium]|nr:ABC transporter permease [Lachnospiraceae bacterium]